MAFVVAMPGREAGLVMSLREQLRKSLPGFMVPSRIVLVASMPMLPGGKLDVPGFVRTGWHGRGSVYVIPDEAALVKLRKAWKEALNTEQCDFTQTWEEAGGDSLATLHLLLRIERAFGLKVTFDQMQPQMRINDLAAVLMAPAIAVDHLPLVHLVPGLFGDEPRLARFRQALAGRVGFHVITMQGVCHAATTLRDVVRTASICARDIQVRQPTGPIMLTTSASPAPRSCGGCTRPCATRSGRRPRRP